MIDGIDPQLVFPILVVIAFIFWAVLATVINKVLDTIERKRKNKCN